MTYRVVVPLPMQPALDKTPKRLRNRLVKHLDYLAGFAANNSGATTLWNELREPASGLLRWDFSGFSVFIDVDHVKQEVRVVRMQLFRE